MKNSMLQALQWFAKRILIDLWHTPGVWWARYKLKKAGFVVRKTGGHLYCLYRIGSDEPFHKCNRYGVPVAQEVMMGARAALRGYMKKEKTER